MTTAQLQTRQAWAADPAHSVAGFTIKHMMFATVRGRFRDLSATIEFDDANPRAARVDATLDAASIDTGVAPRDEHLRSPDFFDAPRFPALTFHSTAVEPVGVDHYHVTGELTIRDVTRTVTLDAKVEGRVSLPDGTELIGFSADTTIDRRDFGLTWNQALETGGVLVGHDVRIHLEIEASRGPGA